MSQNVEKLRQAVDHALDAIQLMVWNDGFESAINALDELSNELHNKGDNAPAEILRWAAKELRGDNANTN